MQVRTEKKILIVGIELVIALLHVVGIGRYSTNEMFILFTSYFSDLVLLFGFYFLLIIAADKIVFLRRKWIRAVVMIAIPSGAEILQYFGVYALGRTFDPIDFLCYVIGVLVALLVDLVLEKTVVFWKDIRIHNN